MLLRGILAIGMMFLSLDGDQLCLGQATDFQRTVVFVYAPTAPGENVFLRGGVSSTVRPNCVGTAADDPCAISIRHRVVPQDPTSSYRLWSAGDLHLDWYGQQAGQGSYLGTAASGTPLIWTTSKYPGVSDPTVEVNGAGYTPLNRFGEHFWMLDVDVDCAQTESGWFEFKTYTTPLTGWENDISQYTSCAGLSTESRPYASINHMAKCGKMNVFYNTDNDCNIYHIPTSPNATVPSGCGQRRMFADASEPAPGVTAPAAAGHTRNGGDERIVNGVPASLGRWPWQGVMQYNSGIGGCAGVLIDSRWVVTAAHCVRGTDPAILRVRFGEQNLLAVEGTEQAIRALEIFIHPRYGQALLPGEVDGDYDIALVHLMTPVDLAENYVINTACLPRGYALDAFVNNTNCWATGFGDTKGTSDSNRLNEINVPVYSHVDCVTIWGTNNISVRQVCMGTARESACGGDSGGPLICWQDGRWSLVGITSWGTSVCQGLPSVYTRISELISWIDSVTGGAIP